MHTSTLSHESWNGVNHYEQTTPGEIESWQISTGSNLSASIEHQNISNRVFSNAAAPTLSLYMLAGKQATKQITAGAEKNPWDI